MPRRITKSSWGHRGCDRMVVVFTATYAIRVLWLALLCLTSQYFSYIIAVSFIGGENQSTEKKPLTCCKTLTNPMQSVPITTKVVSLNPSHGEVYSIQQYMINLTCYRSVVFSGYSSFLHQ